MNTAIERLLENDEFSVFVPSTFEIMEKAGEDPEETRPIGGWCSTENLDRQDEIVVAKGLDFSEFVSFGYFNDNHKQGTAEILGYPRTARLEGNRWWTEGNLIKGFAPADKVWELAKAMSKSKAPRKLGFSIEGKVLERDGGNKIVRAKVRNVAITNCFPGDVHVSGAGNSITRRLYSGPMVEIHLATGEKLTGTPNHPILTQRGWVTLGDLVKGYDRVGRRARDAVSASVVAHDVEYVPATFQETFDLARHSRLFLGVRPGRESDFHGDGGRTDVDVVAIHGLLKRRLDAAFVQKFGEHALPASDKEAEFFARRSLAQKLYAVSLASAPLFVRRAGQRALLSGGVESLSESLAFGVGSGLDSESSADSDNSLPGKSVTFGDGERTLSASVGFGDVVSKRVFDFSGHVYNLDTSHGWYEANGIVAHNCPVNTDCTWGILAKAFASAHDVNVAAEKALAAGHGMRQSGGAALRAESLEAVKQEFKRQDDLSFDEAVGRVQRMRPHLSKSTCRRIVRLAMCR